MTSWLRNTLYSIDPAQTSHNCAAETDVTCSVPAPIHTIFHYTLNLLVTHASVSYDALFSHSLYSGWGHTRRCTELRLCMRYVNATPLSKSWKTFSFSRIVPCFLYGLIKYGGTTFAKMFCMFSSTIPTRVTNILYILLFMAVVTYWRKARMILLTWIWTFL